MECQFKTIGGLIMNRELLTRTGEVGLFDPFFEALFNDGSEGKNYGVLTMKTDIKEEGNNYVMNVELPGFEKKNIGLDLKDGYLTITAKVDRDESEKDKKGNYIHRERFSGVSSRSYYVGEIEEKNIKASYKDGVLAVVFPKEEMKKIDEKHSIAIE